MAAFTYRAVTPAGKRVRGSEERSSAKALASSLGTRGLPGCVCEAAESRFSREAAALQHVKPCRIRISTLDTLRYSPRSYAGLENTFDDMKSTSG